MSLDLLPFIDNVVSVLHMLDVGCGEQSHVDERDPIAIVGKEKQFAGIFASWITGRGVFQFQEFRGG